MRLRPHNFRAGDRSGNEATRRVRVWLRLAGRGERVLHLLGFAGRRFLADDGFRLAAGLSYASLLALVPLLAIGLALFSAFPAFEGFGERVIATFFEEFLPAAGDEVAERFRGFVENASRLTGPGLLALAATAILLLSNINGALNTIWRVTEPRPIALRILVYWALLTLGPLLVGASMSVSSYLFATVQFEDFDRLTGGAIALSRLVAILLAALGFALIFFVVPNRRIDPGHALLGGGVSAGLFEALKYGFGIYLAHFPSYEAIYGALATVPIFLVWLFLCWSAVLLGAEVTAALPEWRATRARGHALAASGGRLALALAILGRLRKASREGRQLKRSKLIHGLPATPAEVDEVMRRLRDGGFVARTQGGRWVLARDLAAVALDEVLERLDLSLDPGDGWPPFAETAVRRLARSAHELRSQPVDAVLCDPAGEDAAPGQ